MPQPYRLVVGIGVATWILVTVVAAVVVLQAPAENIDLAIGVALMWVLFGLMAAVSRFTERV